MRNEGGRMRERNSDIPTVAATAGLNIQKHSRNSTEPLKLHKAPMTQKDSDSNLQSMLDDDLRSVFGFEAADSDDTHDNRVSHSAHTSQDDIAFAERLSIPDHIDHICKEVSYLHSRLGNMESSFVQTLLGILSAALKDCLPLIVNESLQTYNAAVSEQFAEPQAQLNKKVVKQLNKQFNISHIAQSNRFVTLHKELSKVIKSAMAKKVQVVGLEEVREDVKGLLESAVIIDETGEHAYKESTLPISNTKVNEESAMVLYNPEKDLVDLTTTEQDSKDDDDLDK
ncbi:hypothetical protein Tco_0903834 [Tanacetum coccineum]